MAVTCRNIMELEGCSKLKLVAGAGGIDKEIRWPYIKNMDTISEWIHGGELVFVLGSWDDISEKGLLDLMKEAAANQVAGVVILCGERYIRSIPKSTKQFANDNDIPLFKMPFMLKLIDITKEISEFILEDREINHHYNIEKKGSLLELFLKGAPKEELLDYCFMQLQPLIEADRVLKSSYVFTLQQYLENNCELLATSKKMYIHRNTLLNRMKKIDELLGVDINSAEVKNNYQNIFQTLEFYGKIDWK